MLRLLALAALLAALPTALAQSDPAPSTPASGLLVMAHGGSPEWNASVEAAVAPLRSRYPVAVAYGMADPASLAAGLDALAVQGAERVAVVRVFLDGRSFLHQTEYFLGLRPDPPAQFVLHGPGGHGAAASSGAALGAAMHGTRSHGGGNGAAAAGGGTALRGHETSGSEPMHPQPVPHGLDVALSLDGLMQAEEVAEILATRAEALSTEPARESVLVLAHGTGDDVENARWIAAVEHLAGDIRAHGFHAVRVETLREDWPESRGAAERAIRGFVAAEAAAGRTVLVVPFRLSGFGPYAEVLDGLDYRAAEAGLLPHSVVTDWIEREYRAVVDREGWDALKP